jgi:hypothetical protein
MSEAVPNGLSREANGSCHAPNGRLSEANGLAHPSPGQGRHGGDRPGLWAEKHPQPEGLPHRPAKRHPTHMQQAFSLPSIFRLPSQGAALG